jgi:hypothetical protein
MKMELQSEDKPPMMQSQEINEESRLAKEQQMHSLIPQNQSRELVDNDEFPPMSQPPR